MSFQEAIQIRYRQTLDYLYETLPAFSRIGRDAIKKDLVNIRLLCAALGNPQERFRSIHIAGTNGKGSTSHGIAAILQAAGYRTGLYTSPHLQDFRERIRVNGVMIDEGAVVRFVDGNKNLFEEIRPSFFEVTVAMAFQVFVESGVEIAVVETGLGGRLDSTNIVTPMLSVITNIGYDHMDILGDTLEAIAREKAGIIKSQIPVLIGERQTDVAPVFRERANDMEAHHYEASSIWAVRSADAGAMDGKYEATYLPEQRTVAIETDLKGSYQANNIQTILAAATLLPQISDLQISERTAAEALRHIRKHTGLRGRWEQLRAEPLVLADVAHNVDGLRLVMRQWGYVGGARKHIIIGFVRDKDVLGAMGWFPRDCTYHFCHANIPRAMPSDELAGLARERGLEGSAYASVGSAVDWCMSHLSANDSLLITGSFFIVGEAMDALELQAGRL